MPMLTDLTGAGEVARGLIEPVAMLVSGCPSDAWRPGGVNCRDCTLAVGTAGTGGVASADLLANGFEKGPSEKRSASELQPVASAARSAAIVRRDMGRATFQGMGDHGMV